METFLVRALQLILSLSILVLVHELGHFLFARLFKVRVEKFYLFFDIWFSLFKFKPKNSETEYGIGWLPLGGYCKISGMIDESMDKEVMAQPPKPYEFRSKPAWQRLLIMVAGVLFNFLLALFIYSMVLFAWGDTYLPLKNVKAGMDYSETFHEVGFRDGDILLAADGAELERFDENVIVMSTAAGTLVAFGMYYFYLNYGYGSDKGGNIQFIFTVMYAVGTLISQFLYPLLTKILNRKQMLLSCAAILFVGYTALFILGFPIFSPTPVAYGDLVFLLYIPAVFIFFGQGIIAIVLIVQLQSTIEYNEYRFGERKEALVSSMRALVAKWGSAIQQGLVYATLAATGLFAITSQISDLEYLNNAGAYPNPEDFNNEVQAIIDSVTVDQKIGMAIGMVVVPLLIMLAAIVIAAFVFKIDEKKYNEMVTAIKARNEGK